ncbi:MAG: hypothetical protein BECKG1743F_GA0114225_105431, partial [Candidatus Kentron sp. G]
VMKNFITNNQCIIIYCLQKLSFGCPARVAANAATLGYDTQPLRGKESGPKTCKKNKKWPDSSTKEHEEERVATEKSDFSVFSVATLSSSFSSSCSFVSFVLLSVVFLFFVHVSPGTEPNGRARLLPEPLENRLNPLRLGRSLALPERPRFRFSCGSGALCFSWTLSSCATRIRTFSPTPGPR